MSGMRPSENLWPPRALLDSLAPPDVEPDDEPEPDEPAVSGLAP